MLKSAYTSVQIKKQLTTIFTYQDIVIEVATPLDVTNPKVKARQDKHGVCYQINTQNDKFTMQQSGQWKNFKITVQANTILYRDNNYVQLFSLKSKKHKIIDDLLFEMDDVLKITQHGKNILTLNGKLYQAWDIFSLPVTIASDFDDGFNLLRIESENINVFYDVGFISFHEDDISMSTIHNKKDDTYIIEHDSLEGYMIDKNYK